MEIHVSQGMFVTPKSRDNEHGKKAEHDSLHL